MMPRTVTCTVMGLVVFRIAVQVACYAASGPQQQEFVVEQQESDQIDSAKLCQELHFDEDGDDVETTNRHPSHPPCPDMNLFESALSSVTTICTNESTVSERRGG